MSDFTTMIGLEIHAQLKTQSKMFCSCSNDAEGKPANTVVCPVCLGMPGTLPVANKEAIRLVAKIGLALGSKLSELSWFDRKHYFYPDLPKGYQISQYQKPFCEGGELEVGGKIIRFNRVHLEEDAGKLIHASSDEVSFVDLNRAGTPLAEIVTEPDIDNPALAKQFLQELRELLRSIGASDADMEKGHLRCDANISVHKDGKSSPIIEIKNLNSFKFVEKALLFEQKRLEEDYSNWPEGNTKITRGFDSKKGTTYILREKEEAKDYRYFPEPDLPPIELSKLFDIEALSQEMGKMPAHLRAELIEIGLDEALSNQVAKDRELSDLIINLKDKADLDTKFIKTLINEAKARKLNIDQLLDLQKLTKRGISSNVLRMIIDEALASAKLPSQIEINSSDNIDEEVSKVLDTNEDAFLKYKSGKKEVIGFLIGQVMKATQGKSNPTEIKAIIDKKAEEE